MGCFLFHASSPEIVAASFADAPANSSTLRCAVLASALGLAPGAAPIGYAAQAVSLVSSVADSVAGIGYFSPFTPSVSQGDHVSVAAGGSATLSLWVDPAALADAPALGWMIVSPDDASGPAQAETIPVLLPTTSP